MYKSGFVAICGRPNVGKSTLMNGLIKHKIAIISPKSQTTRNKIQGVLTDDDAQIIFIDTPGIHKPHNRLSENMNKMAFSATKDVECIVFMVDGSEEFGVGDSFIVDKLKNAKVPVFLVINKIDKLKPGTVKDLEYHFKKLYNFEKIIPISALNLENTDVLVNEIKNILPQGPKYYPDGFLSDHPEEFVMAELIREKILYFTHDEIPHSVAVEIEEIKKLKSGYLDVSAVIIVERKSQKGIIIGKEGQMIKKIGVAARKDMESLLGNKIYLCTFVKVEEDWRNNIHNLKEYGYNSKD